MIPRMNTSNSFVISSLIFHSYHAQKAMAFGKIGLRQQISTKLINQNHRYFLLKAEGDSMNLKGIDNGDLVLIKQQHTADNGQSVVALINDEATIKEYWNNETTIILKPKSTNSDHQPIILTNDFRIQGVVITSFSI